MRFDVLPETLPQAAHGFPQGGGTFAALCRQGSQSAMGRLPADTGLQFRKFLRPARRLPFLCQRGHGPLQDMERPLPVELPVGRQTVFIRWIDAGRSLRAFPQGNHLDRPAAFQGKMPHPLVAQMMFQCAEQIAAEPPLARLRAAEIGLGEQFRHEPVGGFPRRFCIPATAPEEGHDRFVVGGSKVAQGLLPRRAVAGGLPHQRPAGGVEVVIGSRDHGAGAGSRLGRVLKMTRPATRSRGTT